MQDGAGATASIDIRRGTTPHSIKVFGCAADHFTPRFAVVMNNGALSADSENIRGGSAPDGIKYASLIEARVILRYPACSTRGTL